MPTPEHRRPSRDRALTARVVALLAAVLVTALLAVVTAAPAHAVPGPAVPAPTTPGVPGAPDPCADVGCLPDSSSLPPPAPAPAPAPDLGVGGDGGGGCGLTDLSGCVTGAVNDFFRGVVTDALNPLLDLLSVTLLTTPPPQLLPRVGQLWAQSWRIVLGCYGLLVMAAGLVLMARESVQTRTSVKEIAPRLVVGFLAGAASLVVAGQAVGVANALARAVLAGGLDPATAGPMLRNLVLGSMASAGIFVTFLAVFLVVGLVVLLGTYVVRVALTLTLIAGAPLALMCHALPQTEAVAFWWWKAFGGCLAIQLAQSLALVTGLRLFLAPGGFTPFGATRSGMVNLLVALALLWILIKIPFWILGSLRIGGGRRSLVGTAARAYVIATAMGWLTGHRAPHSTGHRYSARGSSGGSGGGGGWGGAPPPPGPGPRGPRGAGGGGGPRGGGAVGLRGSGGGPRGGAPLRGGPAGGPGGRSGSAGHGPTRAGRPLPGPPTSRSRSVHVARPGPAGPGRSDPAPRGWPVYPSHQLSSEHRHRSPGAPAIARSARPAASRRESEPGARGAAPPPRFAAVPRPGPQHLPARHPAAPGSVPPTGRAARPPVDLPAPRRGASRGRAHGRRKGSGRGE